MRIRLMAFALFLLVVSGGAGAKPLNVLYLSTFGKDLPAQMQAEEGLDKVVGHRAGRQNVYFEYLDSPRLDPERSEPALGRYLRDKYAGMQFDAVVAAAPQAARFLGAHLDLFPTAQRLYTEIGPAAVDDIRRRDPQGLFLTARADYAETLTEALRLARPARLVVVGDTSDPTAANRIANFQKAVDQVAPGLATEYWVDQKLSVLEERVAALPKDAILFYLLVFNDGEGHRLRPYDVAERLARRASVPLFAPWESLMGSGVVGGKVLSQRLLGENLGQMLLALGEGAGRDALENLAAKPSTRFAYDWRQLQRWGWAGDVPPQAVLSFYEPSMFERYRREMIVLMASMALLSGLSLALARALLERRKAVKALAAERETLAERVRVRTAELDLKAQELARSNTDLESFAYVASHDLRQPLRMVSSYLRLLERALEDKLDDEHRTWVEFAVGGAKRMDALILDLLHYSRVGRGDSPMVAVNLADVMGECLLDLQMAAADAGATFAVAPGLPQVRGDRLELLRLFENLMGNAIKFHAPDRPPVIRVDWRDEGAKWVIAVQDNGIGIAPEHLERIFGVFQRLVRQEEYEGTGIGLAVCRKIVDHHQGRIWVESEPGRGTTFNVALPKMDVAA